MQKPNVNFNQDCNVIVSSDMKSEVEQVVQNYQATTGVMTGPFTDPLLAGLVLLRGNIDSLKDGLKDLPEIDAIRTCAWTFLYQQISEKGLKQIHGHTIESLLRDKAKVDGEAYPALMKAAKELRGILDSGIDLLNILTAVLEKNESSEGDRVEEPAGKAIEDGSNNSG